MTKKDIKNAFFRINKDEEELNRDYEIIDDAYQILSPDEYQNRMLNIILTYDFFPDMDVIDRLNYNEGSVLFQSLCAVAPDSTEEDCLLLAIEFMDSNEEKDNPYFYMGVVQTYSYIKKLNKEENKKQFTKKYYS